MEAYAELNNKQKQIAEDIFQKVKSVTHHLSGYIQKEPTYIKEHH